MIHLPAEFAVVLNSYHVQLCLFGGIVAKYREQRLNTNNRICVLMLPYLIRLELFFLLLLTSSNVKE